MGKTPSLILSLIPIVVLSILLFINVIHYGDLASHGPNQMALFLSCLVAGGIGVYFLKVPFSKIEKNIINTIAVSIQAILILLIVGALIGTWIISGVVPTIVVYGLKLLSPAIFLPMSAIISFLVAIATGGSWSTTGTIGVALMGVGEVLGMPPGLTAGAILSGAYLGDKISPLSDITNLVVGVVEVNMIDHVKHAAKTAFPSFFISLLLFSLAGFVYSHGESTLRTNEILTVINIIESNFTISPFLFIVPISVMVMVTKKINPLMALSIGVLLGGLFAALFQKDLLLSIAKVDHPRHFYAVLLDAAYRGPHIQTGNHLVDTLFSRGGMKEMLNTVWIIISAMVFTGILSETKMLIVIGNAVVKKINSLFSLTVRTTIVSIFTNFIACDQYLSVVIPGRILREHYLSKKYSPLDLSRTLGDSGAVTSCLVPWNSCGAYQSAILGISTLTYFPFCFFSFINPLVSIFFAKKGWTSVNISTSTHSELESSDLNEGILEWTNN